MANTYVEYTGDGSQKNWTITFPYLRTAHIGVTLDDVTTTAYTIAGSTLSFTDAPDLGVAIKIARSTPNNELLREYGPADIPTGSQLSESLLQSLYSLEELSEGTISFAGAAIPDNGITLAKLVQTTTATFLARKTAGTGNWEAITVDDLKTLISVASDISTAVDAAVNGTSGKLAVFSGTHAVGNASSVNYTESATSPKLGVEGTNFPFLQALRTGGADARLGSGTADGYVGTNGAHDFGIRTNNTSRLTVKSTGTIAITPVVLTHASPTAWDCSVGNFFTYTPSGSVTINASNVQAGARYTLAIKTSGTSSYTLTFGTNIKTGTSTLATGTVSAKYFIIVYEGTADGLVEVSRTAAL